MSKNLIDIQNKDSALLHSTIPIPDCHTHVVSIKIKNTSLNLNHIFSYLPKIETNKRSERRLERDRVKERFEDQLQPEITTEEPNLPIIKKLDNIFTEFENGTDYEAMWDIVKDIWSGNWNYHSKQNY